MNNEYLQWLLFPSKRSAKGRIYSLIYNAKRRELSKNSHSVEKVDDPHCVDIFVVSFNNYKVIQYQISLLKKYLVDPFHYIVFDNSTDESVAKEMQAICDRESAGYVRLEKSKANKGSENHAIALNYIYHYWAKKRNAEYLAFLDHDIFLIKPYSIISKLHDQEFFGYFKQEQSGIRYLWPGLIFFKASYLQGKHIDFMTYWKKGGDTGSSNYCSLYRNVPGFNLYKFADFKRINIIPGGNNPQGDVFSIMDNAWLHMLNASKWNQTAENYDMKEQKVFSFLDDCCDGNSALIQKYL